MSSGWAILSGIVVAIIGLLSAVWVATLTRRASPYDSMVKRVADQDDRIDELQAQVDALRTEVGSARDDARASRDDAHEARNAAEQAVDENVAWADHHFAVVGAVATLRHAWPVVPRTLQHRISRDDYPDVPIVPAEGEHTTTTTTTTTTTEGNGHA